MNNIEYLKYKIENNPQAKNYFEENFRFCGQWHDEHEKSIFQGSITIFSGRKRMSSFVFGQRKWEKLLHLLGVSFSKEFQMNGYFVYSIDGFKFNFDRYKRKYGGGVGIFPNYEKD